MLTRMMILIPLVFTSPQSFSEPLHNIDVIDAIGKFVGALFEFFFNTYTVVYEINNQIILLDVKKERYGKEERLYFLNSDCAGDTYIRESYTQNPYPYSVVTYPENHLYIARKGSEAIYVDYLSYKISGDCHNYQKRESLFPADYLGDLDDHFTPPFSLKTSAVVKE